MRLLASISILATLLLTVLPVSAAETTTTARPIGSLSAAELDSLPDATLVTISETGRTVSLGVLRTQHQLRLQRFANAANLGKAFGELKRPPHQPGTLVPMSFSLQDFYSAGYLKSGAPSLALPADFMAFCNAALATGCLYFPSGVPLTSGFGAATAGAVADDDPLILDKQLCQSEGGYSYGVWGCVYYYPLAYILNFNPGQPTAQGFKVTDSTNCPSPFANPTVDPHGALALHYNPPAPTSGPTTNFPYSTVTLTTPASCVVSVFVQ